jgi:dihydroorotate dehydrogenase
MYKEVISPMLDPLDSETWHVRAREALHYAEMSPLTLRLIELMAEKHRRFSDERLNVVVGGVEFDNPIMVGGGWDKSGRAVRGLWTLGFSGVEVGSVLAYPQPGNPKPRQFMLGPGVALNRLGFNSGGMEEVDKNLSQYLDSGIPIGISIGKNKNIPDSVAPEMHALVAERLYEHTSYFVINVSSPNTPGLRELQDKGPLTDIVQSVNETMERLGGKKPLFVKIAPDLSNEAVNDVIEVVVDNDLTGIVATNTTIRGELKAKYGENWRNEAGGLSGDDLEFRKMATEKVAHIYKETSGQIEIIGVGGVKDTETALEKIKAGAKVIQVVTAIRGEGPALPGRINRGLVKWMEREGIGSISEIVGQGHDL